LGNTDTVNKSSPVQIGLLTNWLTIAAGYYSSLASQTNGTLWSWGFNNNGQLGLGNTTDYSSPKQIGALTNWGSAYIGTNTGFAIKTSGTLWAWGRSRFGERGYGAISTYYSSPNQVGSSSTWLSISSYDVFTLGLG
jgi:alpha-tubulin suppressor-like RCC1 family protein